MSDVSATTTGLHGMENTSATRSMPMTRNLLAGHVHKHLTRSGPSTAPERQRVGRDGRQDDARYAGSHHGAARGQVVCGGAGGRADQQAIALHAQSARMSAGPRLDNVSSVLTRITPSA